MPLSEVVKIKNVVGSKFKHLTSRNGYAMIQSAHQGLQPKVFYDLAAAIKMPEKNLAALINLSARTISNYKEQQKVLAPIYSEHLLKLIHLFEKGENLFGNIDEFNYWLNKPFWNSKEKPADWMITPGGVDLLLKEMDKLAEGYPV